MSAIYACDGCGKQAPGTLMGDKPDIWYQVNKEVDGRKQTFHACSRACIDKVAEKFEVTKSVLPW